MKLLIESTALVLEGPPTESFKVMGILFSISDSVPVNKASKTLFTKQ